MITADEFRESSDGTSANLFGLRLTNDRPQTCCTVGVRYQALLYLGYSNSDWTSNLIIFTYWGPGGEPERRPSRSSRRPWTPTPVPTPWIDPHTCDDFEGAVVINNPSSGAQCQSVTAQGIGNDAILNAGYLDAVDVWAYVAPGTEICFAREGEIIMLDASTSPRQPVWLPSYESAGYNCASIDRAGTIVLMTRQAASNVVTIPTPVPGAVCTATVTAFLLNFRAAPNYGAIIGAIIKGTTVTASERDGDWLRVTHASREGWIHSDYVTLSGDCAGLQ